MRIRNYHLRKERWKDVVGYEGLYQVSNFGRVKSFYNGKEKILKPSIGNTGYLYINLCKNGKHYTKTVHRLIATTFISNTENKDYIDHINTDRTDNRVCNLRWVTRIENNNNSLTRKHNKESKQGDKGYYYGKFGKEHPNSIPILQFNLNNEFIREWECSMEIQRELNIYHSNITKCCKGIQKTAGGYVWRYKN